MHPAQRRPVRLLFLALLALGGTGHGLKLGSDGGSNHDTIASTEVCEAKTINYITHTLPQQCLRTAWSSPTATPGAQPTEPGNDDRSRVAGHENSQQTGQASDQIGKRSPAEKDEAPSKKAQEVEDADNGDLATSSFMSFEEWKEMMLRKSGQDPADIKGRKQHREHGRSGDGRDPGLGHGGIDAIGDDGGIDLDFDALSEKVSELTGASSSAAHGGNEATTNKDQKREEEPVLYDNGKTQYYRSKDAGVTCKERFSYSSFDAGATVLKTSPGAKNAKALLVENKDSYMLLECHQKDKFVIVELSDDILVDTIVLANFEFFSSMIRRFRVSVSDRYPVKADKWVDLGTFEARNSRDIQPFLVEHPQIYTKYIRIEFLSHYGTEYYCPVSLLRVHGTRMLDSWKEPDPTPEEEMEETIDAPVPEEIPEISLPPEPATDDSSPPVPEAIGLPQDTWVNGTGLSLWTPASQHEFLLKTCAASSRTIVNPTLVTSDMDSDRSPPVQGATKGMSDDTEPELSTEGPYPLQSSTPSPVSKESALPDSKASAHSSPSSFVRPAASNSSVAGGGHRNTASSTKSNPADSSPSSPKTFNSASSSSRNKTSSTSSAAPASPTVQESFFKTVTKRLQLLESNTSLSLQYIEEQSRFLQEALTKIEKKQISRVDSFLDSLNQTVLTDLRNVRTQYDQIWQSTVIALETQREQAAREMVALTGRLNVLAEEVVFQKRMAILQSLLLLACLVLVIFSRSFGPGGASALDMAVYQYQQHHRGSTSAGPSPRVVPARSPSMPFVDPTSPPLSAGFDPPSPGRLGHGMTDPGRHRHPLSRSMSYQDKVLPMTPTTEYGSEPTPIIRIDEVDVPFFHDVPGLGPGPTIRSASVVDDSHVGEFGGSSHARGVAAVTPPRSVADAGDEEQEHLADGGDGVAQPRVHTIETIMESDGSGTENETPDGRQQADSKPTTPRRAPLSQSGSAIKPLPALPEDPSPVEERECP